VYQTEDEENFMKDSYIFRSLLPGNEFEDEKFKNIVNVNYPKELHKINVLNEYSQESLG